MISLVSQHYKTGLDDDLHHYSTTSMVIMHGVTNTGLQTDYMFMTGRTSLNND